MEAYGTPVTRKWWSEALAASKFKSGSAWTLFFARIAVGFVFLWGGFQKILTQLGGQMATAGFLSGPAVANSPFAGFFNSLAGNWTVEYLVVYGELLVGVALILGIFVRLASVAGMLQMLLFTLAMLPIADRPSDNPIVDLRIVYMAIFAMFVFLAPGRFLGLDGILEQTRFVQRHPRLKWLLG